jgi:hypothetical protein
VSDIEGIRDRVRNLQGMRWGMDEYRSRLRAVSSDPSGRERLSALQDRADLDVLQDRYDRDLVHLAILLRVEVSIVPGATESNPRLNDEVRSLLEHALEALGIDLDPPRR